MSAVLYEKTDLARMFLPVGEMLQVDSVLEADDSHVVCEVDAGPGHWVYPLHFPDDPIFPACLLIEAAGQAVAIWGWHNGLRGKPRLARVTAELSSPVTRADGRITLRGSIRKKRHICIGTVDISAAGRTVGRVEMALAVVP